MPREYRKNLSIAIEAYDRIKAVYDEESPDQSFTKWTSDYILMNLEKDAFLSQYVPHISKIAIQDNVMTLKDSKKNKYVEIKMKNGVLQSSEDDPIYLQYALALPEIVSLKK